MNGADTVTLTRDVVAAIVPSGTTVTLRQGETAEITQALGGSYTVIVNGNMFRVSGSDADALGKTAERKPASEDQAPLTGEELEDRIWESIKTVYDPEIPVNIVDLGLVYDCHISDREPDQGKKVEVKMTLTAPGCGMGDHLRSEVQMKIQEIPGVGEVLVDLVWEPQWDREMMTDAAKLQLGLY